MLAFVHIAKTGGTTISNMLRRAHGPRHCDAEPWLPHPPGTDLKKVKHSIPKFEVEDYRRLKRVYPMLKSVGGHPIALYADAEEVFPDTQYLVFVREPLARGVSHFQYHLQRIDDEMSWESWIDWEVHHDHMTKMMSRQVSVDDAIRNLQRKRVFVGLMERYDESLVMFGRLFMPGLDVAYERQNVAPDNRIANQLRNDKKACDTILEYSRKDVELYDYVANEYYPSFRKEYGATLEADVEAFRAARAVRQRRLNQSLGRAYRRLVYLPALRAYRRRQSLVASERG